MNHPRPRSVILLVAGLLTVACARHSGFEPPGGEVIPPLFETRIEINSKTGTHSDFHVGDLNGDAILDMAVIGVAGEMKIMLGNRTDFVDGDVVTVGGTPIWIDGGDLDRDGDRDLVVVQSSLNSTAIYYNDGAGTFTAGPSLPVGADTLAVRVADCDGDGVLDIVVSRMVAPEIFMFRGIETGGFEAAVSVALPGGGSAINVVVGDATRDGTADFVIADSTGGRLLVYPGHGSGFGVPFELAIGGSPRAVSMGDLSGDGLPDLAVSAFEAGKIVVVTGFDTPAGGGPVSYSSFEVALTSSPGVTTIADVTGDGLDDLVSCQLGVASLIVLPQLAGGGLGEYVQLDGTGLPLRPVVGDVNGDGRNDLLALAGLGDRINLWLARDDGGLAGARSYDAALPVASFLGGGDFDGDGDFEVAVGGFGATLVTVMERHPEGGLRVAYSVDVGGNVLQLEPVDLDRDGLVELLVSVPSGVKVLRNRSTSAGYEFEVMPDVLTTIGSAAAPFGLAAADLDIDGDWDIAVCDYGGQALHVIEGTADPFVFGAETVIPMGGGVVGVAAADFTGDGFLDLAVSRLDLSDIVVLKNDGLAAFTPFLTVPVGLAPNYLITGDFNRDLRADLIVSNASSGTVTVLFGEPTGFAGHNFPAGQAPTALLADDLNGDGIDDVLVTSLQSGDFHVLVSDGSGGFPGIFSFPGTLGASDALLQDMDGDGSHDLLISSLITNRVSLVRNLR